MGLAAARSIFTALLNRPNGWQVEQRPDLAAKNFLAVGTVTATQVIEMLNCCDDSHYRCYPHVDDNRIMIHDFRPRWNGARWIVKCYLLPGAGMFISVHPLK